MNLSIFRQSRTNTPQENDFRDSEPSFRVRDSIFGLLKPELKRSAPPVRIPESEETFSHRSNHSNGIGIPSSASTRVYEYFRNKNPRIGDIFEIQADTLDMPIQARITSIKSEKGQYFVKLYRTKYPYEELRYTGCLKEGSKRIFLFTSAGEDPLLLLSMRSMPRTIDVEAKTRDAIDRIRQDSRYRDARPISQVGGKGKSSNEGYYRVETYNI